MRIPRFHSLCVLAVPIAFAACVIGPGRPPAEILQENGLFYTPNGSSLRTGLLAEMGADATGAARTVVEPDVYRFSEDGAVLYTANAYRGLLAFDVSDRPHPVRLGGIAVAGTPKELYLRSDAVVLLLDPSYGSLASQSASSVLFLSPAAAGTGISVLAAVTLAGTIVDSRVVDDVLLVATNDGWDSSVSAGSGSGTTADASVSTTGGVKASLRAVSLVSRSVLSTFEFPGYCTAIHIDPACVFAASQDAAWGSTGSDLIRYDFGVDGTLSTVSSVRIRGSIQDRFKLDYRDGILRVVASDTGGGAAGPVTRAFGIDYRTDATAPSSHEDTALSLAPGERLFATRFSGDTCYVVTYRVKDPLFVVSFADPVHPVELGQLGDIPGYSTHIEVVPDALGHDRLFTVGVDDTAGSRVKVSWFDASNPAAISEIGHVLLGDSWSYSAANWDWKRISRLPELSAFAVPYYSLSAGGGQWAVALVGYSDTAVGTLCELLDSGDCLRTIAAASNLVYTYADDRLLVWQVAAGSAVHTVEVVIAEDAAWASEIGGTGVKVVRDNAGAVVKTFDPALYDRTDSTGNLALPGLDGNRSGTWYSLDSRTVAKGPDGIHLLAGGYDPATGTRSAILVPVRVRGGLSLGTVHTFSDTSGYAWVSCLPSGARFLPAAGDGRIAVFHGGLTLFDAATGAQVVSIPAENGIAAFVDGDDAWVFSHAADSGYEGYGMVTAVSWDIADPASPKKRFEASFPGFPVHYAGGGRFLSAFEVRQEGSVSTVLMSVTVTAGNASILKSTVLTETLRAGWSQPGLFAFLQGEGTYWGLAYAASPRSAGRPRGDASGITTLRTAAIGADGSIAFSDVGDLSDAGWRASLVRDNDRLAAQAGRAIAVCDVESGALSWRSSRLLDAAGWNEPVVSLASDRLYWALGMEGIGREATR